jgi:hypothetical protein
MHNHGDGSPCKLDACASHHHHGAILRITDAIAGLRSAHAPPQSGRSSALLHHSPLRTVRAGFPAHGSSLRKAPFERSRMFTRTTAMDLSTTIWVQKNRI